VLTVRLAIVLAAVALAGGCGQDEPSTSPDGGKPTTHTLPDGMTLSIPAGATFWYSHVEITSGSSAQWLVPQEGSAVLTVARIDWYFCDPSAARLDFLNAVSAVIPGYTWRVPTVVSTPLAGISVLGIFSGGNLEGGLVVPIDSSTGVDAEFYRITGCAGSWVSLYGYSTN
jgi:hypothetical protein